MVVTSNALQSLLGRANVSVVGVTALVDSDGVAGVSAGDGISYQIELNNTGTTTLIDLSVTDTLLDQQRARLV